MDTHDTHLVSKGLGLHPGMVITVEPGIYISENNENVPERFAILFLLNTTVVTHFRFRYFVNDCYTSQLKNFPQFSWRMCHVSLDTNSPTLKGARDQVVLLETAANLCAISLASSKRFFGIFFSTFELGGLAKQLTTAPRKIVSRICFTSTARPR